MFQQLSYQQPRPKKNYRSSNSNLSKDTDWTVIRKMIVSKWICKPDWCCLQIRRYLGSVSGATNVKLKLISGYFSLSGFRSGAINYPCVVNLKTEIFNEIKLRKSKGNWSPHES